MIKRCALVLALPTLMAASGCLASKGDIRLIQDELRSSRSASATSDTAQRAQADSIAKAAEKASGANTARLEAMIRAQNDSIRALHKVVDANQAAAREFQLGLRDSLRYLNSQMGIVRALAETFPSLSKNMKATMEANHAQIDSLMALRDALARGSPPPVLGSSTDSTTSAAASAAPSGIPGPATLQQQGLLSLNQQSYSSARRSFQLLIDSYPTDELVPETYMYVGRSYAEERNTTAADSVYQFVVKQYPRNPVAGTALYRRGVLLEPKNPTLAHSLYLRVVNEYPTSEAYPLACAKVRSNC